MIIAALSVSQTACDRIMPAGFWSAYQSEFIKENSSDQGPWGGCRTIHWESEKYKEFDARSITAYAEEKGWSLVNCVHVEKKQLKNWVKNGEVIFPAFLTGFEHSSPDSIYCHDFPRLIDQDLTVCKFKTGWVRLYPGTNDWTEENGFILTSEDGRKMTLYHLWGE